MPRLLDRLTEMRRHASAHGARATAELSLASVSRRLLPGGLREASIARPLVSEFDDVAEAFHTDARELVRTSIAATNPVLLHGIESEYASLRAEIDGRYAAITGRAAYPIDWRIEEETAYLLYATTRLRRPKRVLETGVANGHSSFFLLRALRANGDGTLHSVDVSDDVGQLVDERERKEWQLTILQGDWREHFRAIAAGAAPIDVFVHDSNHSYRWQEFEYATVLPHMAVAGILASDDVDFSYAFLDFCAREQRRPVILAGRRKVFGYIALGAAGDARSAEPARTLT